MFKKNLPRGIIFLIDLGVVFFSLVLAYLLRFNFNIPQNEWDTFVYVFPTVLGVRALSFLVFNTYAGILRYTSTKDVQRILLTAASGSALLAVSNPIVFRLYDVYAVPYSIIIIEFLVTVFGMTTFRLLIKTIYLELMNPNREKTNVLIFGSGESGLITKRTLDRDAGTRYKVLAFLDDDPNKSGKKIEGIPIYSAKKHLEKLLSENEIKHLIIAIQNLPANRKEEIVDACLKHRVKVLSVPPVVTWINGMLSFKQIKKIRIEDLLERQPIRLDTTTITQQLQGKRILITGAAGSIGSEIARQVVQFSPEKVILLDCAESPLYDLELEFGDTGLGKITEPVVADIRNQERMDNVFRHFKPQVVFHAAAYKHVPMMELNPSEAILTNVLGTKMVADLAHTHNVEEFVMVSTDKAVNPTSIMGATKRIAEIYIQSLNALSKTRFVTTRFGNVLGSNGSVIPRFNKQIEAREPITITHPEIVRYFMTIPEACQLVLEAAAMGKGGEIFIFDMGKPVKIVDLAKKMIQLNGLELDKDIRIAFTGLRPGEKLYEELLANEENTITTHHEKIMVAKVKEYEFQEVKKHIEELITLFDSQDNLAIVKKMKQIVPEYISNNSVFEELDKKN